MIKTDSTRYPFLAIAQRHDVVYALVLRFADHAEQGNVYGGGVPNRQSLWDDVKMAVARERARRAATS